MKKIVLFILIFFNFLFSAQVEELSWPKGETFLTFLEKYSVPQKLYFDLEKEDRELCSEIGTGNRYYLYTEDDGSLNQVLIQISEDIQLHIYKDSNDDFKFQTLPINYTEYTETIAIPISISVSNDITNLTGNHILSSQLKSLFSDGSVDFRRMRKGDFIAVKYTQKVYLGKLHGQADLLGAMVEIAGKKYYRFKNEKDEKYYDQTGKGFSKSYLLKIPLAFAKISSVFSKKRWHPVLRRYRAHLGTDFSAPRGRIIFAAGDGRVEFVGSKGGYGKTIIINHGNGYKTLYGHQNGYAKGIRRGMSIKQGEHIGYVGNTGLSSGPHLHFGLYKNNVAVDPMKVLRKPVREGLEGKDKTQFLSGIKNIIESFDKYISGEIKINPKKLDRIDYKSDVDIM